jgi:hypothetical protein
LDLGVAGSVDGASRNRGYTTPRALTAPPEPEGASAATALQ